MGDVIESKYRPRRFEGVAAVATPSYNQRQWTTCVLSWILWYPYLLGNGIVDAGKYEIVILTAFTVFALMLFGLPNYAVLYRTAFISIAFRLVTTLVIGSRWFDWPWSEFCLKLPFILLLRIEFARSSMPEVVFRYKMWKRFDRFLGTKRAIALSDHVREMMPSLAACDPFLKDAVVSSTQESQFIARWPDWAQSRDQIRVKEIHEIEGIAEPRACSYSFEIGSGQIRVDAFPQNRNNFKFESRARGRLLEEFVTITDWDRIATILSILRYWEKSPDLGVIENLYVVDGDGIYCHCLSLQSIVESVCKSREQFSLFRLSESRRFYVGSVPQQNKKEDKSSISFCQKLSSFFPTVLGIVSSYFLAGSKGSHVEAIVGLCIGLPLASLVFIDNCMSEFALKLFLHWVLVRLCKESWRYRFYRWLKRKGCFLAFCDDFNPVLHRANEEPELITLWNCTPGTSFATPVHGLDWGKIDVFAHTSSKWQWNDTRFVCSTVLPTTSLSTTVHSSSTVSTERGQEASDQDFEWHQGQRRYFELTLCGRTVRALSECDLNDGEAGESENVFWKTQLQFDDDPVEHLKWKESSYLLFVYLMVKWKRRKFGVISGFRKFWSAKYYHVFSTYELARHIRDNEEEDSNIPYSYHILIDDPKPTDMVAGYMHCKDVSFVLFFASPDLHFMIPTKSKKTYYISCLLQNSYVAAINMGR